MWATDLQPFLMGIVVSVVIGIALTLPISSAAICAALGLTGLAGGAAVAGCCAQMVGFAVMSFKENKWGGLLSQGIGTSMLQMGNIVKNPRIWIPPIVASAITGPIATGYLRSGRTDRRLCGLGRGRSKRHQGRHHRYGLDWSGPDQLCTPRRPDSSHCHSAQEGRLDQRRRYETAVNLLSEFV